MSDPELFGPDWRELLAEALATAGCTGVARELGVSHTAISLVSNGKYPGNTKRMAERVLEHYGRTVCPYSGRRMTQTDCQKLASAMPTSSPGALRQWRVCQKCEHNPNHKGE